MVNGSLLQIISRVCKDPRIESPTDSIAILNDDTMYPCSNEFVVQQDIPLCMHRLSPAMGHECLTGVRSSVAL